MTKTTTVTLTEFLLARIAEDEAAARETASLAEAPWRATYGRQVETARDGYLVTPEDEHSYSDDPTDAVSQHIARHDPARVLAECEAKRRIVAMHKDPERVVEDPDAPEGLALVPGGSCLECHHAAHPCPTLRALASVYADHPDYDSEWAL